MRVRWLVSKLQLRIFDGTRQLFSAAAQFLVTITDGNQVQQVRSYYQTSEIDFDLPFFDNFGDNYTALAWTEDCRQAGFTPVVLSNQYTRTLDVMLIPQDHGFNFAAAGWNAVVARYPFLGSDVDTASGAARYANLIEQSPMSVACLLNIGEAASQIFLSQGTPLDYIKQLRWDAPYAPAQDRFFAWCDPALIDQVKIAAAAGQFSPEPDPGLLHPGATASWKQIRFGEANVQLTFHENTRMTIGGIDCVMLEPDIDYYKDLGAHILLEVIPNALTGSLTDPAEVYVLRWMAGRQAGVPDFDPMYTIVS